MGSFHIFSHTRSKQHGLADLTQRSSPARKSFMHTHIYTHTCSQPSSPIPPFTQAAPTDFLSHEPLSSLSSYLPTFQPSAFLPSQDYVLTYLFIPRTSRLRAQNMHRVNKGSSPYVCHCLLHIYHAQLAVLPKVSGLF